MYVRAQAALAEAAPLPPTTSSSSENNPTSTKSSLSNCAAAALATGAAENPLFPTGEEDADEVGVGDGIGSIPGVGDATTGDGTGSTPREGGAAGDVTDSIPGVGGAEGDGTGSIPRGVGGVLQRPLVREGTGCRVGAAAVGALRRLKDLGLDVGVNEHTAALFACAGDSCGPSALAVLRYVCCWYRRECNSHYP